MGAIYPAWIKKDGFLNLPFNYCDRWCEWCKLTKICKVYLQGQTDRKRAIAEGKDPDSMEFTFEIVQENLQKIFELVYKDAKKMGIPLKELNKEPTEEEIEEMQAHKKDPLYKTVSKFSDKAQKFLQNFAEVPLETDLLKLDSNIKIIAFYHTFIFVKTARALSSERENSRTEREFRTDDDRTSAFIAAYGLQKMAAAFLNLAEEKPLDLTRKESLKLAKTSLQLAKILSTRFSFPLQFNEKYCLKDQEKNSVT